MQDNKYDVAIVGAGIVGLAIAYAAAKKGNKVAVFERNPRAVGASIRNFGLVWPIGQPAGELLDRAMRSREIWIEAASESGLWLKQNGSLQLAYHQDEWDIVQAFHKDAAHAGYKTKMMTPGEVSALSPAVKTDGLKGALYSSTECTVTSRLAIPQLTQYLEQVHGVEFHFGTAVSHAEGGLLTDFFEIWRAERIYICSGADFETLYPQIFRESGITKCKLQMMRTVSQPEGWDLGPSLCAGLTLLHYHSFAYLAEQLRHTKARYDAENPAFSKYGIHVLVSQNNAGEIILGDSHEYGWDVSPFDKEEINRHILSYLSTFAELPTLEMTETWHGVYPKLPGKTEFVASPAQGVLIVNGLSGAGMTMSFGLAETLV